MRLLDLLGTLALTLVLCKLLSGTTAYRSSARSGVEVVRNLRGCKPGGGIRSTDCGDATEQLKILRRRQIPVDGWSSLFCGANMLRLKGGSIVMEEKSAMELDEGEDRESRSDSAVLPKFSSVVGLTRHTKGTRSWHGKHMIVDVQLQELHRCAREGDVARVQEFASSALINQQDLSLGFSALHFAAREGQAACVQALIEEGADVHARSRSGYTPLHLAAAMGHAEIAEQLLMAGAEPAVRAMNGDSAVKIAARAGHELVAIMLQACAVGPEAFAKSTQVIDSDEVDGGEGKEMGLMDGQPPR